MSDETFDYCYKNNFLDCDLTTWPNYSETLCRVIDQDINWSNLGSVFFKHNDYQHVLCYLFHPNQNLFNAVRFCETNDNCFEIEIVKKMEPNTRPFERFFWHSGHHIFASCPTNLKMLIEDSAAVPSMHKTLSVNYIHNYGPERQTTLSNFMEMLKNFEQCPRMSGIAYKKREICDENFERFSHLWFTLDLRKFCGDVSQFNQDPEPHSIRSTNHLISYVERFHAEHVRGTETPTRQVVWTFLRTLAVNRFCSHLVGRNLDWRDVKLWGSSPGKGRSVNSLVGWWEQGTQVKNTRFWPQVDHLSTTAVATAPIYRHTATTNHLYENNVKIMIEKMKTSAVDSKIVFKIHETLFNITVEDCLKTADKRWPFLFDSVQKHSVIGLFFIPTSGDAKKELILVVNNAWIAPQTRSDLVAFVKDTKRWTPFLNSHFKIMFDGEIFTKTSVDVRETAKIIDGIFDNVDTDRIDGRIVEERQFRND